MRQLQKWNIRPFPFQITWIVLFLLQEGQGFVWSKWELINYILCYSGKNQSLRRVSCIRNYTSEMLDTCFESHTQQRGNTYSCFEKGNVNSRRLRLWRHGKQEWQGSAVLALWGSKDILLIRQFVCAIRDTTPYFFERFSAFHHLKFIVIAITSLGRFSVHTVSDENICPICNSCSPG